VILTMAWKEYREHRAVWFTMVLMTGLLTLLLAEVIVPRDATMARMAVPALTILGMAATYGVVCGGMMFAGEHETSTMVFLDIFLGQRGLLWLMKFLIGVVLAVTQALAVALVLNLMKHDPPEWLPSFIGLGGGLGPAALQAQQAPTPKLWFEVLPVLTVEAFAWGLLGSAMTRRVLSGAAVAALIATPIWMIAILSPPPIFIGLRLIAVGVALVISFNLLLSQSRDASSGTPPRLVERRPSWLQGWQEEEDEVRGWDPLPLPAGYNEARARREWERRRHVDDEPWRRGDGEPRKRKDNEAWARHDGETARPSAEKERRLPPPLPVAMPAAVPVVVSPGSATAASKVRRARGIPQAESPRQVMLWLMFRQAWPVFGALAGVILIIGMILPANGQLLWPLATLLLGVACGTATFAQEQSDLSYQFLASQHLPLKIIWKAKVLFWLTAALVGVLLLAAVATFLMLSRTLASVMPRPGEVGVPVISGFDFGTLRQLLGWPLFFGAWLVYGFATAHVFVMLCRKVILAVLLSTLVSLAAFGLWLPLVLCGGMSGWQPWLAPLGLLVVSQYLVRAWAGGRIKERKQIAVLIGFGVAAVAWLGLNCALRAWEIPDVGAPLDRDAFRASLPRGNDHAGQLIEKALGERGGDDGKEGPWLARMRAIAQLPVGVIEAPSGEGHMPLLRHLPECRKMAQRLRMLSLALSRQQPETAFEHLAQVLALSRNLRNKAPVASYLTGVEIEEGALGDLTRRLAQRKASPKLLRHILDELNRHASETPSPLDCLQTECFRAGGTVTRPVTWSFYTGDGGQGRVREGSIAGSIALSLEMPWEDERKTRLWEAVWAGLFRAIETPHWKLPEKAADLTTRKAATGNILNGWLPATDGAGASITLAELASLLDNSWLADERLFAPVVPLRSAATRARWRIDSCRLTVALGLYQLQEGKTAATLEHLVPKYLPELPIDPYSGTQFRYRISPGEDIDIPDADDQARKVQRGQAVLWSTGPDKVDDGGHRHGGDLADDRPEWPRGGLDLIAVVPFWP
jgi:hypothetical protein